MSKTVAIVIVLVIGAGVIIGYLALSGGKKTVEVKVDDSKKVEEVKKEEVKETTKTEETKKVEEAKPTTSATELKIEVLKQGTGDKVTKSGDMISVHYTGTLTDGTKFDSSLDRGTPFKFDLGAGQVIKGWDQGLVGMKIGEKRKLTIPPSLGYGDKAVGGKIPANSTLIFEVELIEII